MSLEYLLPMSPDRTEKQTKERNPPPSHPKELAPNLPEVATELAAVMMAVKAYAKDHAGLYPNFLTELMPRYLVNPELLKYEDTTTGESADYVYFDGHAERDPGEGIVLAAPSTENDGKRWVAFKHRGVMRIAEGEYRELAGQ